MQQCLADGATDHALAVLVYAHLRDRFVTTPEGRSRWTVWQFDGTLWRRDPNATALSYALSNDVCRAVRACAAEEGAGRVVRALSNAGSKAGVLREFAVLSHRDHPDFLARRDANPDLIAFTNGVFDLARQAFRPAQPSDGLTVSTGYAYAPPAPADTRALQAAFLERVFVDPSLREHWLTELASMLDGRCRRQKFHVWSCGGANGKTACANLLAATLGGYCGTLDAAFLQTQRGAAHVATPEIMALRGCRVALLEEPEPDRGLNEQIIKAFSGGGAVTGRALYGATETFTPQYSLVMCCNDVPAARDGSLGWARRLNVVPFPSVFGYARDGTPLADGQEDPAAGVFQADPDIAQQFPRWRLAFFELVAKRYHAYRAAPDFTHPVVAAATRDHVPVDLFAAFVAEALAPGEGTLMVREVERAYEAWLARRGEVRPESARQLYRRIRQRFHPRRTEAGMEVRGWQAVRA